MKTMRMAAAIGAMAAVCGAEGNRWVHLANRGLGDDKELLFTSNVIVHAAKAGMKEVVWSGGLDTYWLWNDARKARFLEAKRIAEANGIGIVPMIWSTGYATMTGVDASLIESVFMPNMPYVAKGGRLVPDKGSGNILENGGFERLAKSPDRFEAWSAEKPGLISFVDTETFRSGKASIRMEPGPGKDQYDHARLSQHVALKPGRLYRASAWFKVSGLNTANGHLRLQVYLDKTAKGPGMNGGKTAYDIAEADGWKEVAFEFATGESAGARIWCGTWGAKEGKFWVDDVSVEEIGLKAIAQHEDSPRTIRSAATGKAYELGKDWLNPANKWSSKGIEFPLPKGSAIKEGERVLLDTYIPGRSGPKMQISSCMSDPKLYELFRKSAEALEELLHPDKWFLSLDEVRNGGTCPLCAARRTDMAHILAGCVLKQHEIIRSVHPGAEIYAWSDMFDPFHNAKDKVCGCKGTFVGIWDLIPRDVIMVLWHGGVLDKSVPFFTEHGFKVMGSVCCDSKKLDMVGKWKTAVESAPGSKGFMYTTWRRDFGQLDGFAELIGSR